MIICIFIFFITVINLFDNGFLQSWRMHICQLLAISSLGQVLWMTWQLVMKANTRHWVGSSAQGEVGWPLDKYCCLMSLRVPQRCQAFPPIGLFLWLHQVRDKRMALSSREGAKVVWSCSVHPTPSTIMSHHMQLLMRCGRSGNNMSFRWVMLCHLWVLGLAPLTICFGFIVFPTPMPFCQRRESHHVLSYIYCPSQCSSCLSNH